MNIRSLILLLLVTGSTGAWAQSMLKVRLTDNSVINVAVDGRYFNKKGTSVTVGELPPGRHKLTIYTVVQTRYGRGHEDVIYSGKIFTHAGNITLFTYDVDNQQTDEQEQDMNSYMPNNPPQVNNNNNDYGNDNRYIQSPRPSSRVSNATATLTDVKIDQLKTRASDKKTDTEKLGLMKDGLGGETMTTAQIGMMMDFFNFEDTKVEFAKWAYSNAVDKENFSSLESKLSYQNYVDELDKFIKGNK